MESAPPPCCAHPDIEATETYDVCMNCGHSSLETEHPLALPKPKYEYRHLHQPKDFRLIRIKPGQDCSPIRCEIYHSNIHRSPIYEAISYTWADATGDRTLSKEIKVKGRHYLRVTRNCEAALRRLRLEDEERVVWIDAICIDQEHDGEKGHQVRLMPEIYSSASRVLIYLGEEADDSSSLMDALPRSRRWLQQHHDMRYPEIIAAFFSRSWFHRVWVFQEVALAKNAIILCGKSSLPWQDLISAFLHLPQHNGFNYTGFCPSILRLPLQGKQTAEKLLERLQDARSCQCEDPRDMVYATLGLFTPGAFTGFHVDYTKTAEQVYVEIATHIIKTTSMLEVLRFVEPRSLKSSLPSWVPDWRKYYQAWRPNTAMSATLDILSWEVNDRPAFAWSTSLPSPQHISKALLISGTQLDEIFLATRNTCPNCTITEAQNFRDQVMGNTSFQTLLRKWLDSTVGGTFPTISYVDPLISTYLYEWLIDCAGIKDGTDSSDWWLAGKKIFVTRDNNFGVGPPNLEIGDKICHIRGYPGFCLLRTSDHPAGQFLSAKSNTPADIHRVFQYVGECYALSDVGLLSVEGPEWAFKRFGNAFRLFDSKGHEENMGVLRRCLRLWHCPRTPEKFAIL